MSTSEHTSVLAAFARSVATLMKSDGLGNAALAEAIGQPDTRAFFGANGSNDANPIAQCEWALNAFGTRIVLRGPTGTHYLDPVAAPEWATHQRLVDAERRKNSLSAKSAKEHASSAMLLWMAAARTNPIPDRQTNSPSLAAVVADLANALGMSPAAVVLASGMSERYAHQAIEGKSIDAPLYQGVHQLLATVGYEIQIQRNGRSYTIAAAKSANKNLLGHLMQAWEQRDQPYGAEPVFADTVPDDVREMARARHLGMTLLEVANTMGVTKQHVHQLLKRHDLNNIKPLDQADVTEHNQALDVLRQSRRSNAR